MKISKDKLKQIVREELASITENKNKFFIVDPTGMRGEPAYYRRKSTNDDSAFEFSTLWGATGFDSKGSANTTMRRIKNSSRKYRGANLKVLRGDELHEETISEKESKFDHDIFFGLQKLISKNAKNNKLKGYSSEVAHAIADILTSVEEDRLAIGDVFNGLKIITKKIEK